MIVGGHSHSLLSNTYSGAEGPYPTVVQSPAAGPVLVVQTGTGTQYLGIWMSSSTMRVLPFGNLVSTFSLTGADLKAALENGVSRWDVEEGTGRFA